MLLLSFEQEGYGTELLELFESWNRRVISHNCISRHKENHAMHFRLDESRVAAMAPRKDKNGSRPVRLQVSNQATYLEVRQLHLK